jgi:hypothetical protein
VTTTKLRDFVIERDAAHVWATYARFKEYPGPWDQWIRAQRIICIVPAIDPDNPYPCGGKQEIDHVKDAPMMGKRAPDDEFHLVAMCQNHNTWHPPRRELRQAEREYLAACRNIRLNTASSD